MLVATSLSTQQISASLEAIASNISRADQNLSNYLHGDEWAESAVDWYLQLAFAQLLTLAEALQLPLLRSDIARDLESAKEEGLSSVDHDPNGDPHLKWAGPVRRHVRTIQSIFAGE